MHPKERKHQQVFNMNNTLFFYFSVCDSIEVLLFVTVMFYSSISLLALINGVISIILLPNPVFCAVLQVANLPIFIAG
jgi:hypothetical protein